MHHHVYHLPNHGKRIEYQKDNTQDGVSYTAIGNVIIQDSSRIATCGIAKYNRGNEETILDSIKIFPNDTPIYTSKIVRKLIYKKKLSNPIYILDEKGMDICSMNVKSLPTSYPYYSTTFSLLFEDKYNNKIFHEGHIVNFKYLLENNIKADVAILTAEEVKLFGFITLGMNYKKTIKACELLGIKDLFITGNNPKKTKGLISNFLSIKPLLIDKLNKKFDVYYKAGDSVELNNRLD